MTAGVGPLQETIDDMTRSLENTWFYGGGECLKNIQPAGSLKSNRNFNIGESTATVLKFLLPAPLIDSFPPPTCPFYIPLLNSLHSSLCRHFSQCLLSLSPVFNAYMFFDRHPPICLSVPVSQCISKQANLLPSPLNQFSFTTPQFLF